MTGLAAPIPLGLLLPETLLIVGACAVLLMAQAGSDPVRRLVPWTVLAALVAALAVVLAGEQAADRAGLRAGNGLLFGGLAYFVRISALELGILIALVNWYESRDQERGEFTSMMLIAVAGLMLVGAADNLWLLFIAVELVSVPTYVLVILSRGRPAALEAGTKYFFLGALSTAFLAYGFSYLYGMSGTASIPGSVARMTAAFAEAGTLEYGLVTTGVALAIGGLLFKMAAVPFHFYVADVYQGASSAVAGLLGFVPKLAGLVAIYRIVLLTGYWERSEGGVFWLLWLVAALSMTVGNVLALRQSNIKRLLAYSGIAHAGYMLVGVVAGPLAGKALATDGVSLYGDGPAAALFYMVIYGIANLTAFAVLALLRREDGQECETLRDVAGLLRRAPTAALLLALAMFTLMSLPPTPGFWGKVGLFGSALTASRVAVEGRDVWLIALVVIGVVNSALAAAYYLRVVAAVLLYESETPARAAPREALYVGGLMCGFLLLIASVYPSALMGASQLATRDLLSAPRAAKSDLPEPRRAASDLPELPAVGKDLSAPRSGTSDVSVPRPAGRDPIGPLGPRATVVVPTAPTGGTCARPSGRAG